MHLCLDAFHCTLALCQSFIFVTCLTQWDRQEFDTPLQFAESSSLGHRSNYGVAEEIVGR